MINSMEIPPVNRPMTVEEYQASQEADQLRILAILKTIYGALIFVGSIFVVAYFAFMGVMFSSFATTTRSGPGAATRPDAIPPAFGSIFLVVGIIVMIILWALGGIAVYSGKCIRERRNWTLVMVSACLNCLHMPLGTALGVYTIIVINKPSVRAQFDRQLQVPYP